MSRPRLPQALLGQASAVLSRLPEVGQNPLLRGLLQNWLSWPGVPFLLVHDLLR